MGGHTCTTIVITCIDFRFQEYINRWIEKNLPTGGYDRVAWAGGVKDQEGILKQVEISHRLHHIKRAILINHEDCGAYGEEGTPKRHQEDLQQTADKIKEQLPELEVEAYYLHLDGIWERILLVNPTEDYLTSNLPQ